MIRESKVCIKWNKTGNVSLTLHWSTFTSLLFQWKGRKDYQFWLSVCIIALITRNSKHVRCIILSPLFSLVLPYFFKLSHKGHNFWRKQVIEHRRSGLIFSTNLFATFLILRKTQREIIINVYTSSCKIRIAIVMGCGGHPTTDTITWKVYRCHHFGQHHDTTTLHQSKVTRILV